MTWADADQPPPPHPRPGRSGWRQSAGSPAPIPLAGRLRQRLARSCGGSFERYKLLTVSALDFQPNRGWVGARVAHEPLAARAVDGDPLVLFDGSCGEDEHIGEGTHHWMIGG